MHCQIFRILDAGEVRRALSLLERASFADGKETASGSGKEIKRNLQIDPDTPEANDLGSLIWSALRRNEEFQRSVFPKRIATPLFSRYDVGMEYGAHVDSSVMFAGTEPLRADLASTIFLSDPASYDGGELVIEFPFGEQEIKLDAGEAVVYSATTLHRVTPVTRGQRLVALTWIQTMVPDERLRTVLADLAAAVRKAECGADRELAEQLNKSYHNLLRYAIQL